MRAIEEVRSPTASIVWTNSEIDAEKHITAVETVRNLYQQSIDNMPSENRKGIKAGLIGLAIVAVVVAIILANCLHVIEEGHVGVYFRNGALQVTFFEIRSLKSKTVV